MRSLQPVCWGCPAVPIENQSSRTTKTYEFRTGDASHAKAPNLKTMTNYKRYCLHRWLRERAEKGIRTSPGELISKVAAISSK